MLDNSNKENELKREIEKCSRKFSHNSVINLKDFGCSKLAEDSLTFDIFHLIFFIIIHLFHGPFKRMVF